MRNDFLVFMNGKLPPSSSASRDDKDINLLCFPGFLFYLKSWYIDECNRQLNDAKFYRQLDGDITDTIQQRVTVYIERMFNDGYIDEKTKKYLVQTNVKPGRFYMLPKIHKTGNPGRPIVSSNSHPTGTHLTIC